jgi:2,5-diketo-D-gluconate reductase A
MSNSVDNTTGLAGEPSPVPMQYTTLNSGAKIPMVGFGVYQIPPAQTKQAVLEALKVGYRLIDTAEYYRNEREVGQAVREAGQSLGIPRDQIFVTTKLPPQSSYQSAAQRIQESYEALNCGPIDLMIIHWPGGANVETYRALEDARKNGTVKAIGLSSFYGSDYQEILDKCSVVPALDQNETHVFRQQRDFQPVLEEHGTKLEAWSPFAEGEHDVFNNPTLKKIGQKHGMTTAQVMLRYLVDRGIIVIPKTVHVDRMRENIDLFRPGFELDDEDRKAIVALDRRRSLWNW